MSTTQQDTATPRNSSGTAISGKTAVWSTTNAAVATVNSTGLVTAVGVGGCDIRATIDGVIGTSPCEVNPPNAPSYRLSIGAQPSVTAGQSVTIPMSLARVNGYTGTVTVTAPTGIPGVTVTVGPSAGSQAATHTVTSGGSQSFFMVVTAAGGAGTGVFPLNVTSTGTGGVQSNAITQVNIVGTAVPSITGTITPTSLVMVRGTPQNFTVNIIRNGGYTGEVTLAISSSTINGNFVVNNANNTLGTLTFSPQTIPAGSTSSTVTLSLPVGWDAGTNPTQFVQLQMSGPGVSTVNLPALIFTV